MSDHYKILWEGGQGELVEKKSRFIATTEPVETEEEALAFIERTRKKYWDARHNCFAYCIGDKNQLQRCSDDGEPSQTAGRPMLDVLLGAEVHNICVVVTRYFGGTLLGTGGLVRAYSGAVQEGLSNSTIVEKCLGRQLDITTDYTGRDHGGNQWKGRASGGRSGLLWTVRWGNCGFLEMHKNFGLHSVNDDVIFNYCFYFPLLNQ